MFDIKEYREKNKERLKAYRQQYWLNNKERLLAEKREEYRRNRDRYREYGRKYHLENKAKHNEQSHQNYIKNKGRYRVSVKKTRRNQRLKVLSHYTNGTLTCNCGFSDERALCIDHVNNNGAHERKMIKGSGIYAHIIRQGYPPDYQVLCANCNQIKEMVRRQS
jgi:hypothetical protein